MQLLHLAVFSLFQGFDGGLQHLLLIENPLQFAGTDEVITLSHTAQSRALFAAGTVRAVLFLADKETGFYNMDDLVRSM